MGSKLLASAAAFLGGSTLWFKDQPKAVVPATINNEILTSWASESFIGDQVGVPECEFYNHTLQFDSMLCSHLAISRSSSAPTRAADRALRCAAAFGAECILSAEIGLGIPAIFLYNHKSAAMDVLMAPKLLEQESEVSFVRVAPPSGDGITDTFTLAFNNTVRAEYLDGLTKQLKVDVFTDQSAFCIQLLRISYEPECWRKLDG